MRALSRAFNSMSARLAADTEERRRLLADVSHELRTPLTVIQGNVEGMLDGLYPTDRPHLERVLAEARQLERLVDDLRTLSWPMRALCRCTAKPPTWASWRPTSSPDSSRRPRRAWPVVEPGDVPPLELDPMRMRQVIGNLVSNALRHTPPGGSVTVRVRSTPDAVELDGGRHRLRNGRVSPLTRSIACGDPARTPEPGWDWRSCVISSAPTAAR